MGKLDRAALGKHFRTQMERRWLHHSRGYTKYKFPDKEDIADEEKEISSSRIDANFETVNAEDFTHEFERRLGYP